MNIKTSSETYRIVRRNALFLLVGNSNDTTIRTGSLAECRAYCERFELQVTAVETEGA